MQSVDVKTLTPIATNTESPTFDITWYVLKIISPESVGQLAVQDNI